MPENKPSKDAEDANKKLAENRQKQNVFRAELAKMAQVAAENEAAERLKPFYQKREQKQIMESDESEKQLQKAQQAINQLVNGENAAAFVEYRTLIMRIWGAIEESAWYFHSKAPWQPTLSGAIFHISNAGNWLQTGKLNAGKAIRHTKEFFDITGMRPENFDPQVSFDYETDDQGRVICKMYSGDEEVILTKDGEEIAPPDVFLVDYLEEHSGEEKPGDEHSGYKMIKDKKNPMYRWVVKPANDEAEAFKYLLANPESVKDITVTATGAHERNMVIPKEVKYDELKGHYVIIADYKFINDKNKVETKQIDFDLPDKLKGHIENYPINIDGKTVKLTWDIPKIKDRKKSQDEIDELMDGLKDNGKPSFAEYCTKRINQAEIGQRIKVKITLDSDKEKSIELYNVINGKECRIEDSATSDEDIEKLKKYARDTLGNLIRSSDTVELRMDAMHRPVIDREDKIIIQTKGDERRLTEEEVNEEFASRIEEAIEGEFLKASNVLGFRDDSLKVYDRKRPGDGSPSPG